MSLVLVNGCFDVLHPGHLDHLEEARAMGDYLIVALTLDEFVNKPGRPVQTWEDRAKMLRALRVVSCVAKTRNAVEAINLWHPNIFVKGPDYEKKGLLPEEIEACEKYSTQIRFTKSRKQSTTELVRKLHCVS